MSVYTNSIGTVETTVHLFLFIIVWNITGSRTTDVIVKCYYKIQALKFIASRMEGSLWPEL